MTVRRRNLAFYQVQAPALRSRARKLSSINLRAFAHSYFLELYQTKACDDLSTESLIISLRSCLGRLLLLMGSNIRQTPSQIRHQISGLRSDLNRVAGFTSKPLLSSSGEATR